MTFHIIFTHNNGPALTIYVPIDTKYACIGINYYAYMLLYKCHVCYECFFMYSSASVIASCSSL